MARLSFVCLFFLIVLVSLTGCFFGRGGVSSERAGPGLTSPSPASPGLDSANIEIVNALGEVFSLVVEIPPTREAMARGLMGRESMPENQGMLFLLGGSRSGFWMKDTLIPLSVAFISSHGVIRHIEDMEPQTLDIHNTSKPYIYGLEVNKGWFERRGVKPGDTVRFPWPYDSPPKSPWELP
jgi:uncharacterized membrane protein (UPF0127 family)